MLVLLDNINTFSLSIINHNFFPFSTRNKLCTRFYNYFGQKLFVLQKLKPIIQFVKELVENLNQATGEIF